MEKKLRRTVNDRKIAGVCGGLAKFFGIDPVAVRVAMAILTFVAGMSLLVYILMWIIVPEEE